jgi:hypothetical protein
MLTNNNSESLNHVLKQAIDWKSQPLLDIVNFLTKIIETQCKDLLTLTSIDYVIVINNFP